MTSNFSAPSAVSTLAPGQTSPPAPRMGHVNGRTWPTSSLRWSFPHFPLSTPPWPGELDASRPGQIWRLTRGRDEWAWGGIYQIICSRPESDALTIQRWSALPGGLDRRRPIIRTGSPTPILHTDFVFFFFFIKIEFKSYGKTKPSKSLQSGMEHTEK